jgi:23S rRNA (guanosine2251-2'-O)-methyltransferase
MSRNRRRSQPRGKTSARANVHAETSRGIARLSEEGLLDSLAEQSEPPLILVLDGVQDPHNLGACLRTADGAGVLAVVVPRHKTAPVTETVVRIACGAAASVPVVTVSNLARFLQVLRDDFGIRSVGTSDHATEDLFAVDLKGPIAMVLGAEEKGMRRLTMENCDQLVTIPMRGDVPCLNVSNATAVCLYEAVRQRGHS